MERDTGALPLLALYLALLLAVTLGVVAARQRWSTALVWVVAARSPSPCPGRPRTW